jgi:hypothetical protein
VALNGAHVGIYTSNMVYREVLQWFFLWVRGSLGSPLDSQFFFRAWALVSSKGTFIYIRQSPHVCAFVCVSLGLKKSRDFIVSEGQGWCPVCDGARVCHRRTTGPRTELGSVKDRRQGPARQKQERGWLVVTVASMGGLGTGESLQVLCGAQVCGTAGVSIKLGQWRSLISPRRPGSRAINQALCHEWTETGPLCFQGCRRHRPKYPSSVVSLLSLYSLRKEGPGTSRLRLTVSEGHEYPLV